MVSVGVTPVSDKQIDKLKGILKKRKYNLGGAILKSLYKF